ncbi:MAG: hypothetical protein J0I13_10240 [Rhizobiales bacterium]|jgi:hypothetical protein|nr:hypothetical protein [Hyphomicrobiales bacterium]
MFVPFWRSPQRSAESPALGKMDIVHRLMDRFGYSRYLEIATSTTGLYHHEIKRGRLAVCRRLLYNLPPDFSDGQPIDYACAGLDISPALTAIAAEGVRFDIMLVDPYHGYEQSYRDIAEAFTMLEPGGALVVHDCLPPDESLARPEFTPGSWCGVTYKAYLDFVLGRADLRYLTVDTDYGCGVVRKVPVEVRAAPPSARWLRPRDRVQTWRRFGDDYAAAWRYFSRNTPSLLRLVGAADVLSGAAFHPLE